MRGREAAPARRRIATGVSLGSILLLAVVYPQLIDASSFEPLFLLIVLTGLALISYLFLSVETGSLRYSATFIAVLVAAALLGPAPAAVMAIAVELVVWCLERYRPIALLCNLAAYGWAGALAGLLFAAAGDTWGVTPESFTFYLLTFPIAWISVIPLFLFIVGILNMVNDGKGAADAGMGNYVTLGPSHLLDYALTGMIVFLYVEFGLAATAAVLGVALMNQFLIQRLLAAHDETKRLASLNTGILASLVRGLHMRDRDTARHSAAVARYAREMATELGWPKERQELVHTAALLHDIGKFAFPDRILKGGNGLRNTDWEQVYKHPGMGAELLRSVSGYGPIADIVAAHHERPDGRGYPDGLMQDEIPEASRLIAVADAYDVITARGGYNKGRSSFDALRELRRCSSTQFDGEFVEALSRVMAGKDLRFRHGDDADFDAEVDVGSKRLRIAVG